MLCSVMVKEEFDGGSQVVCFNKVRVLPVPEWVLNKHLYKDND